MSSPTTAADLTSAIRERDRSAINDIALRLLAQGTRLGERWSNVAQVLVKTGEVSLAVVAAERAVQESGSINAKWNLAQVLANVGRQADAMNVVSEIPGGQLNPWQRHHFLGTCALENGDLDFARKAFERVLEKAPASSPSWLSLSALPGADDQGILAGLDAASSTISATPPDNRAQWHYAKGNVLDRKGQPKDAFTEFSAGAELMRSIRPFDRAADRDEAERLIAEFSAEALGNAPAVEIDTGRPIIVTGLPRSGTTLVEHMLAAHSAVSGGGEVPFASILTREIGGNSVAALEAYSSAQGGDALARLYLHLGDERFGAGTRFVDKWLGNTRTLGLVASVLPQARIIWLRRNPLDCAWSCFRTYFTQRLDWSWSLEDIADHFQAEDRLYEHWRALFGERLLTVSYEDLVAESDAQIDRILAHVGLKREAAVDEAHSAKRAVTTASLAQVREPIYQRAVGSAEPYREWLRPFIEAYGDEASAG